MYCIILWILCAVFSIQVSGLCNNIEPCRNFTIDYENNQFRMDGKPFRYISGSIHYFRSHHTDWQDKLRKLKYGGFNAVQTYVEWSSHEPEIDTFDFSGNLNIEKFLKLAQLENLNVILRAGPYICAERDLGGLPYWIKTLYPNAKLRTSDIDYMELVDKWFTVTLLPKIKPYLYENGGPIIAIQIENEYGNSGQCDHKYTSALRDIFQKSLGTSVVLFTTDNPRQNALQCGKIPGVYATVDFGPDADPVEAFAVLRLFEPKGPLINSEYYAGWLDHWGYPRAKKDPMLMASTMEKILNLNASVNVYMFHGGTNFGFSAGSNILSNFQSNPTTYDYDALLNEAGDPTNKYFVLRDIIKQFNPLPPGPVPPIKKKFSYGIVRMAPTYSIFDIVDKLPNVKSKTPLTFEQLSVFSGIVLYETNITSIMNDPSELSLEGIHDRGYVFINEQYVGTTSRALTNTFTMAIYATIGDKLSIFVENEGRISVGYDLDDIKGITKRLTLDKIELHDWKMTPIPLLNTSKINFFTKRNKQIDVRKSKRDRMIIYKGTLSIPKNNLHPQDTFVDTYGWSKGILYINGFNLGRFWPRMGPQITLYVPRGVLRQGNNDIVILEIENSPNDIYNRNITFIDKPNIDGPVPN